MGLTKEELQAALAEAAETTGLGDFAGQAIVITGYSLSNGVHGEYAIIEAVTADGEEVTITTGGKVVLPQLKKLDELDAFPVEVQVVTFPTRFGNDGFRLEVTD